MAKERNEADTQSPGKKSARSVVKSVLRKLKNKFTRSKEADRIKKGRKRQKRNLKRSKQKV